MRHTVWGLALLLASAPGIGQTEEEPYFALASAKTFGPGEEVSVQLNAWNVDSLDFRVYRVNDPVRFFEQLDDPHMFGGRAPRPPREQTLLERFHGFKREWRTSMETLLRAQFSQESRHRIRAAFSRRPARTRNVASYAEAPLLNAQQLVATWRQPVTSVGRWETQTVPIEVKGKGVYLVEAVHKQLRAYTIVMVSDLAMITKQAPGRMVALVVHRKTGQPVPDAEVTLWSNTNTHVATKSWKADAQGLVDAPVAANNNSDLRLMARDGGEFAVLSLSAWSIGARLDRDWSGYIYTDRPVYRPGHTVDFKGIVRALAPNGYAIPKVRDVDVSIEDPDQKSVYHKRLPMSPMGAVHDSLTLPMGSSLGYYSIQIHADAVKAEEEGEGEAAEGPPDVMTGGFQVEEYKKPEYEVRVTPVKPRVIEGESVQATIDARYYFGEPVKNAKVTWAVYRSTAWLKRYEFEGDEDAGANNNQDEDTGGEQAQQNEGRLDDDGKLTIAIPTDVSEHAADFRYRIEARVTDEGNREIIGTGWLSATFASFYLEAEPDQYVYAPGSRARINITALDYDGNPVRTPVKAQLQEWHWGNRREVTRNATDVTTDAQGHASVDFTIPSGGEWRVVATSPTPEKRQVEDSTYLWVSGGDAALYGQKQDTLQIVPDKKSYRPGDTAKILVVTGVPRAKVLVTVEGRTLDMVRVVDATSSSFTFEVPVRADQAPSFYVGAAFIRGGEFYSGSKVVKVPPVEQSLAVAITTSKPQYKPGERAHYEIEAKDSAGRPVAAEFSLGVVDEAIYGIRKDDTEDILSFFYGRNYNVVNTDNSLSYYFRGEAGKRRMQLALLRQRQKLTQLKPDRLIQPKVRKAFPDTIFWSAEVNTGASGRAGIDFDFPDSLTTWRATARGVTADTKVGAATQKTIVRKNVILRLAVPRFFTQGDEMTVSAIVHNYLTDTKAARVSLEAKGLELIGAAWQDVSIPSKGDVKVDFRVKVPAGVEAVLTGKALTDEESDAMELTLPVYAQGVKLSDSRSGSLAGGQTDFTLNFPQQVAPGSRKLEMHLSPSVAGAVFGALDYLTSFPYGCTEQTMSSFLPNIVVAQAMKDLNLKTHQDPGVLQQQITAGMERLYDFQHEDGGWGWWKTDDSEIFMTAYVISGLAQAKAAGQPIKDGVLERATKWLRNAYDSEPGMLADLKAYANYALALEGASDGQRLDAAWAERSTMTAYGTAQMGLAFDALKDPRAAEAARLVESKARQNDSEAWWPSNVDTLMSVFVDSSPEVTAYAVKLISRVDSQSPLLPKAALWLMNHRNEGWYWFSTEQTAMVVFGLTDYLKITKELNASFTATVFVNDKPAGSKAFTAADALAPGEFVVTLRETDLNPTANRVRVRMAGTGRLYWSVREEYSSTEPKLARSGTVALNILRDYYKLSPSKSGDRIVWDLNPLQGSVGPGDILAVRLTVTGGDWRYLMIEDPIPAGAEFIERDDLYDLREKPGWWGWWFTRRELHDNRMAIFQTFFSQGQQQYVYLLKVVNPGVFHVNPAKVQPMYQPDFFATTEARTVEVK